MRDLAEAVGEDPTLTDRTKIWAFLLSMHTNPLLGTGYESFWLGPRLQWFWQTAGLGALNEAHNGYLEVYLNLGIIGLFLLCGFLIASLPDHLQKAQALFQPRLAHFGSVDHSCSSTMSPRRASRSGLMWLAFLLGAIAVPECAEDRVRSVAAFGNAGAAERFLRPTVRPGNDAPLVS